MGDTLSRYHTRVVRERDYLSKKAREVFVEIPFKGCNRMRLFEQEHGRGVERLDLQIK